MIRMDPHHFGNLDRGLRQSEKLDPDPHQSEKVEALLLTWAARGRRTARLASPSPPPPPPNFWHHAHRVPTSAPSSSRSDVVTGR
jgi:hypothetical protein